MTVSDPLTHAQLIKLLRQRYHPPAHALFEEVPDGTGGTKSRTIDALAMSLYPSKGLYLHGFEVKASRSDWLREVKDPSKADGWVARVDHFWVVANRGIVKPDELPPQWGLLEPVGNGLRMMIQAPKVDAVPVERPFLASIFRQVERRVAATPEEITSARREGWEAGQQSGLRHSRRELERLREELDDVREFERELGVRIAHCPEKPADLGRIVRRVLDGERSEKRALLRMKQAAESLERVAEGIREQMGEEAAS